MQTNVDRPCKICIACCGRLFHHIPNNPSSPRLLNIFSLAIIKKNDITNSKIRRFWQALIILNYGDISTYYFEWNNVLMCLLHVCLMAGSGTLREWESHSPTHTEINCSHSSECYSLVRGWEEKLLRTQKHCKGTTVQVWFQMVIKPHANTYGQLTWHIISFIFSFHLVGHETDFVHKKKKMQFIKNIFLF